MAYSLEKAGFGTRRACTGEEGLAQARLEPVPDLVLLDLMLPDIQGTEVCRRLRRDSKTAQIPVIMVTARDEEIDRVVGFEVGAEDYVVKPYSVRELILRIRALLRRTSRPLDTQSDGSVLVGFPLTRADTAAGSTGKKSRLHELNLSS